MHTNSVFYCMCTLKIDLFNVIISKCDAVVQYIKTIYKGKSMCIMKQSDQILSRRFLCSLVLLIKRQESVPLICFSSFRYQKVIAEYGKTLRYSIHKCWLFLFCSVSSADRQMQLDLCETILRNVYVTFFLMLWLLSW